ncbi:hypothetical protein ALC57_16795 [Trachymyrmex cornetzi]|uniref:Uncharacterized protein n=1 Tax=Trachymyrmex cornetzi TaxID=471704 RepID=A0A151IUG3_9HYME|nr:hypothetical protein ALC57_16795 [Trachymyrmex cornetzi]
MYSSWSSRNKDPSGAIRSISMAPRHKNNTCYIVKTVNI